MIRTVTFLIVCAIVLGGSGLLQYFLSRLPSRWPGLILPGVCVAYSLVAVCSFTMYGGKIPWGPILMVLLVCNVPTAILLAIYFGCRGQQQRQAQMEKMQKQDLPE